MRAPGVYVDEVASGTHLIAGVSTSVMAFIGITRTGGREPVRVTSWKQFVDTFDGGSEYHQAKQQLLRLRQLLGDALTSAGTSQESPVAPSAAPGELPQWPAPEWAQEVNLLLDQARQAVAKCVVLPDDLELPDPAMTARKLEQALERMQQVLTDICWCVELFQSTALAVRGFFENGGSVCYVRNIDADTYETAAEELGNALEDLADIREISAVAAPCLWSLADWTVWSGEPEEPIATLLRLQQEVVTHCHTMGNRMAILDTPPGLGPTELEKAYREHIRFAPQELRYVALYYPWLEVTDGGWEETVPPCGHVAGVWARVDEERGVHKAPANEALLGVDGVQYELTGDLQGPLNAVGVNCVRKFPGYGPLLWGARTLDTSDTDWRYVNVRRLLSFLEESLVQGSQWVVFEPNDARLWSGIRRNITAFLADQWRTGALQGKTPAQAFSVVCDENNNEPDSVLAGVVVCDIAVAPVRPAEFVHFRFSQRLGQAQT